MAYLTNNSCSQSLISGEAEVGTDAATNITYTVKSQERTKAFWIAWCLCSVSFLYSYMVQDPDHEVVLPSLKVGLPTPINN